MFSCLFEGLEVQVRPHMLYSMYTAVPGHIVYRVLRTHELKEVVLPVRELPQHFYRRSLHTYLVSATLALQLTVPKAPSTHLQTNSSSGVGR